MMFEFNVIFFIAIAVYCCVMYYTITRGLNFGAFIGVTVALLIGIVIFFNFNIFSLDQSTVEPLPSANIPNIIEPGETFQGTVTMNLILHNYTLDNLLLYIPQIETYNWSIVRSQYEKIPTLYSTYHNLNITIKETEQRQLQDFVNQTYNATTFSSFTNNDPFSINKSNVPWLFPITDNISFDVHYAFIAPVNVSNGTIFFMPPVTDNQITQLIYPPPVKPIDKGTDWFNWLWLLPIVINVLMMAYFITRDRRRSKALIRRYSKLSSKTMDDMLRSIEKGELTKDQSTVSSKFGEIPKKYGDYILLKMTSPEKAITLAKEYRDQGHWVKITNFSKEDKKIKDDEYCGVYISNWKKEEEKGIPKWHPA